MDKKSLLHMLDFDEVYCYLATGQKTKEEVVRTGLSLHVPYELTWSCYEGNETPCGTCGTCIDRMHAFEANGITDPLLSKD